VAERFDVGLVLDLRSEYSLVLPVVLKHLEWKRQQKQRESNDKGAQQIDERIHDILEFQSQVTRNRNVDSRSFTLRPQEAEAAAAILAEESLNFDRSLEDDEAVRRQNIASAICWCLGEAWSELGKPPLQRADDAWLNTANAKN